MNTRNTRLAQENPKMQVLSDAHLQELQESGLTEIPSNYVSLSAKEAKELTGYSVDGLAIYYHQKDGNRFFYKKHGNKQQKMFVRFKPNWKTAETAYREKFEDESGELPKYLTPKGAGCRPYFSQFVKDWELKLKRAKEEIDITEGEKKADKACLEGFTTIGLSGVTCFMDKRIQEPTFDNAQGSQWDVEEVEEQVKPENSTFLPELEEIKWGNRSVGICYDSDILRKLSVQRALLKLFTELKGRNAFPFPIFLPCELDGSKNGLDDFLVRHGKEAYGLLRNACKAEQASVQRTINITPLKDGSVICTFKDLEPSNHIKGIMAYAVIKEQWAYREGVGFYEWTGTHWSYKGKDAINAVLTEFQDAQGWVRRSSAINSFLRSEMETRLRIPELIWNDGNYLGFTNGYLNAQNNEFMPCDKTKYLTSVLPYEFNEKATCPTWLKFLDYALNGNQELIKFLQAWFKWVLMPKNKNDVFPIQNIVYLIGRKGTGKGTALNILMKLVGEENTASATPKTFGNPEALGRLLDKKLGVDPDATQYLEDVGDLNKVVSNELVEIRKLYVGSSQKRLGCVLTMAMNEFIKVPSSGSEGLLRRIIPVPFMKRPKEVDPDLAHKLQEELAGIFQWAWQLSFTQVKHRIIFAGKSEAIAEQAKERFYHDNPEFEFLKEQFPYGTEILSSELYSLYAEWARSSGFKVMSLTSFGSKLTGYYSFEKLRKQSGNVYVIPNMTNFDLDEFLGLGGNKSDKSEVIDYQEIITQIDDEYNRLGWQLEEKVNHLFENFGVKKRQLLKDEQLPELLAKLRAIPTPPNLIPIDEIPVAKDGYGKVLDISFGTVPNAPQLLKEGQKTVTRRKWKESYIKHFQKAQMRGQKIAVYNHKGDGGYQIGWILIEKIYQEILSEMPEAHLAKEGGMCHTKEHFINRYFDGDSSQTVTVIEFKYFPYTGEIKPIEKPFTPKSNNSKTATPVEVVQSVPAVADSVQNQKKVYLIDDEETEKPELDQQFIVGNCVMSKIDYPDQVGLIVDNKLEGKLWIIKVEWADGKTDFYYPDQLLPYQSSNE